MHRAALSEATGLAEAEISPALGPMRDAGEVVEDGDWWSLPAQPDSDQEEAPIRVTVRKRFSLSTWRELGPPEVVRIEGDNLDVDDVDVRAAIGAAKREAGIGRAAKSDVAERQALLASFAGEYGKGVQAWERWKREHTDQEPYANRHAFEKAARRALESSERRVGKLVQSRVDEAREEGEREAVIPIADMLAAARGE